MKNPLIQWMCAAVLALVCCGASLPQLHAQTPRDTTVTIKGKKFAPGVEVYYDSAGVRKRLDTSRVNRIDSKTIRSLIPGWLLNVPGKYPITVQNPSPSRGGSNSDTLTIVRGAPVVIPRTDTAITFNYVSTQSYWHEKTDNLPMTRADSIIVLTSLRSIVQHYTVSGTIFKNGTYRITVQKTDDPLVAAYVKAPRVDSVTHPETFTIDATTSPAQVTISGANYGTHSLTMQLNPIKELLDSIGSNPKKQFPSLITGGLSSSRLTLAIARERENMPDVIPGQGRVKITGIPGQGRVKITIEKPPTNVFGMTLPPADRFVMKIDSINNYIESTEIWRNNAVDVGTYYKLKDGTGGASPEIELVMHEQAFTIPASQPNTRFSMKAVQATQYQNITVRSYITQSQAPVTR